MKGDVVAFLGLSDKGERLAIAFVLGGFACALALSLIPMPTGVRAAVIAVAVPGAWIFLLVHSEYGLDRLAWATILVAGLLGWFFGFVPAALVRARRLAK